MRSSSPRYGFIYIVRNKANGRRYVGKTITTIARRWSAHVAHAMHRDDPMLLHAAIRKYGAEAFDVAQICCAREELLCPLERFFIAFHQSRVEHGGYNLTDGGDGMSGRYPSEETRRKMSAALFGNKRGAGRRLTDEEKRHLRSFVAGIKRPPEFIEAMRRRELEKWKLSCKNGHVRNPENTRRYRGRNGKPYTECLDCRRASRVAKRTKKG